MKKLGNTFLVFAVSMGVLLLVAALFRKEVMAYVFHELPFTGQDFEQDTWETAAQRSSNRECAEKDFACLRGPMYADLRENYLRPSTTKETVISLLVPGRTFGREPACVVYDLGMCSGLKIDPDYLRICFDEVEKIVHVSHYQS